MLSGKTGREESYCWQPSSVRTHLSWSATWSWAFWTSAAARCPSSACRTCFVVASSGQPNQGPRERQRRPAGRLCFGWSSCLPHFC